MSSPSSSPITNVTNVTWKWSDEELFKWHGLELIYIPIMMLIGIVGNLFVVYIYHFRFQSDTVTLVKRMLAALDLVFLILAMPVVLPLIFYQSSSFFGPMCRFAHFVALTCAQASCIVLVIIAVDRYLKLCLLRKQGISSKTSKKLFLAAISFSSVANIPTWWIFGRYTMEYRRYNVKSSYCFIADNKNESLFIAWSAFLSIEFVIIANVLLVLYSKIIRRLRELSKKHDKLKRFSEATDLDKKQIHSMRTHVMVFIALTVVYFCSYVPYFTILILSMIDTTAEGQMGPKLKAAYDLCKLSPMLNNTANPFIYNFTSGRFRAEIKKIVTLKSLKTGVFRRRAFSFSNEKAVENEL